MPSDRNTPLARREFFTWAGKRGIGLGLAVTSMPAFLAACTRAAEDDPTLAGPSPTASDDEIRAIVGDVLAFELTSEDWEGDFGFVTFRLHRGMAGGNDVYYIRTDTSDEAFARSEELVWAPKLAGLNPAEATGAWYEITGGVSEQAIVLSSEPGRDDYTPAWRVNRARWQATPRLLGSVDDVRAAESAGDLTVEQTPIVINAAIVKWSDGELPVDDERTQYLGPGQLLEAPNTDDMTVMFKLHECYPSTRYIVTDVSGAPMADGMKVGHSPKLADATDAQGTGRTNVFMNGIEGPGPMGFQPSVFDSQAGDSAWSPYWDHMTYAWTEGQEPRVLTTEADIHTARDNGELDEFPGTPDTNGEIFVVNCPVPVLAPNTFTG